MNRSIFTLCLLLLTVALAAPLPASAGQAFIPTSFGLTARGIAMANALTAIPDPGASYFNPAALAAEPGGEIAVSFEFASPDFTVKRELDNKTTAYDEDNEIIAAAMKFDLSGMFKGDRIVALGISMAMDDYMRQFVSFGDVRDDRGQFVRYGTPGVFMAFSLAAQIIPQLTLGVGAHINIEASAKMSLVTDLSGNTSSESMSMAAKASMGPLAGLYLAIDRYHAGLAYRGENMGKLGPMDVQTDATVSQSKLAGLPLSLNFRDNFTPQQVALGFAVDATDWMLVGVDAAWHNWAGFNDEVDDYNKDQGRADSDVEFKDVFVPRLGLEFKPLDGLFARCGYAYEPTPLSKPGTFKPVPDNELMQGYVAVDNAKHVASLGVGYTWEKPPLLALPISFDAYYQLHYLVPETWETSDGYEYASEGMMHTGGLGLTLRF
ncbi:MAG: outer membrane protein transport protein [Candidatus Alcyoniella australis]|nr:outer membrane protein transport protein [Candidatus Alcyoniella australis]